MKIVLLDGCKIEKLADVHRVFAEELAFPEWYGRNLDALFDLLTETREETGVIVVNAERMSTRLGGRYDRLMRVLRDAQRENPHLHLAEDPFAPRSSEPEAAE